jgi:hypothetical protein
MKRITVRFPPWVRSEGLYPVLRRGQRINVALEVELVAAIQARGSEAAFTTTPDGRCTFQGTVLDVIVEAGELDVIAIDAGGIRFFSEGENYKGFRPGEVVTGEGLVSVEDYLWSEFHVDRPGAPDLYLTFEIERLRCLTEGGQEEELVDTSAPENSDRFVYLDLVEVTGASVARTIDVAAATSGGRA